MDAKKNCNVLSWQKTHNKNYKSEKNILYTAVHCCCLLFCTFCIHSTWQQKNCKRPFRSHSFHSKFESQTVKQIYNKGIRIKNFSVQHKQNLIFFKKQIKTNCSIMIAWNWNKFFITCKLQARQMHSRIFEMLLL